MVSHPAQPKIHRFGEGGPRLAGVGGVDFSGDAMFSFFWHMLQAAPRVATGAGSWLPCRAERCPSGAVVLEHPCACSDGGR